MLSHYVAVETLWLLMVLLRTCPSHALNLDDRSPTVVRSGVTDEAAGFGWDIAQHKLTNGTNIVLISAPRGNGTSSFNEGLIYACPFDIDQECHENVDFGLNNSTWILSQKSNRVNLEGQLLGYSLRSFGDRVVATAPYHRQSMGVGNTWRVDGRIVSLDGALDPASFLNFIDVPFNGLTFSVVGIDTGRMKSSGENLLLANDFYNPTDYLSGTIPGSVYLLRFVNSALPDVVTSVNNLVPEGIQSYSGFHLETGYFTTAPGSNNTQAVMSSPRGEGHLGYVDVIETDLSRGHRIVGEEVDGYFGYDVAVLNFGQADGYESLVIGCPLCRTDSGRVYVYMHTSNPNNPFTTPATQVINSPSFSRGRFGIGVEAIGDIDLDGFTDVAISAPYQNDGVVYIYRGSASGLVTNVYQKITPQYSATAFGYSLSGGLDIDGNGYPDLTVTDLSSQTISTIRGSPLVNVTTSLQGATELDILGGSSRGCAEGDVMLHCFNVTPCFYYNTKVGEVSRFALKYNLSADISLGRVGVYENGRATALNSVVSNMNITGSGEANIACGDIVTFALYDTLRDPADILVSIMVEDADDPIALEAEPALARFGKPLHPKLLRYERGDQLAGTQFDYPIVPNLGCASGDPKLCEGELVSNGVLNLADSQVRGVNQVILSTDNVFAVDVTVTNNGMDTSVGSVFDIKVPDQVVLSDTNLRCNVRTENGTLIECPLKEAIGRGDNSTLSISFTFNDTTAFLGEESFNISLSVRDGGTSTVFSPQMITIYLDTLGEYRLVSSVAQPEYSSYRSVRSFTDKNAIQLDRIGPLVTYTALIQNSISGTAFPRSTVFIYLPKEIKLGESFSPLLIPSSVVIGVGVDNVNCSHYQSFSDMLLGNQQPQNYIPSWDGASIAANPDCEKNGKFRCGVIICTIFNLQPRPEPPFQINVFARLYSPAVDEQTAVTIYATISKDTALPRLSVNSVNASSSQFSVVPGPRDVPRDCIGYWVVVVSVVIGIVVLLFLIIVLAFCGVFRRWHKGRQQEMMGDEQTDNEYSFHRRTIPPISGATNAANGTSSAAAAAEDRAAPMSVKEREKQEEADRELADMFSSKEMAERRHSRKSTSSTPSVSFDPTIGLDYGGGEETEI